jgi:hypothetical protein
MPEHCCDLMDGYLKNEDQLIVYVPKFREYGVVVHDGGQSYIGINFCPWCSAKLPSSMREKWFVEIEKLGLEDQSLAPCPVEFETDEWWKARRSQ